jgi:hypothetical protein
LAAIGTDFGDEVARRIPLLLVGVAVGVGDGDLAAQRVGLIDPQVQLRNQPLFTVTS